MKLSLLFLAGTLAGVASCGASHGTETDSAKAARADSSGGAIAPKPKPYDVVAIANPGTVSGTIDTTGTVAPAPTPNCPVAAGTPPASAAIVWLDGVQRGKPMPMEKRYALVSAGCALDPRVQAVVVGGTINVFNDDRVYHRLVFIRSGTHDTLQTMPFTNGGQVVASERLTKSPGIVEVHCAQHPGEVAYIAVFEHPYFTLATGGTYEIDSVPEGERQVMAWREGKGSWIVSR